MRVWYVAHYAVPPSVSPGWRCQYLAEALAAAGHEVTVWAARRHHLLARPCGQTPEAFSREAGGFDFRTVDTPFYRGNGLGRLLNMLAFSRGLPRAYRAAKAVGRAPDLIIVSSPHPFVWPGLARAACKETRLIFEERDVWPESLVELAGASPWHPLVWYLKRLMVQIARRADGVISLLPGTEARFQSLGLPPGRWVWLPNGADPETVAREAARPGPEPHLAALNAAKASGRLTVLYAGSMGPPNALESVLDLARVPGEKKYKIFLMGDGVSRPALERRALDERLDYVEFLPQVGRAESWRVMAEADAGCHSLRLAEVFKFGISPNKIFDFWALGKPVISSVASPQNPVALSGGGWVAPPGQPLLLHEALNRAAAMSPAEREAMGRLGRAYLLERHDWRKLGPAYALFCEKTALPRAQTWPGPELSQAPCPGR
jgi:glycosyltransferase involved in cell wall biosynthesis